MTAEPTAPERGKHDRDQRQRCLIDAATETFAEKGFDAATTREVAERAGCSEGLIHRYFGGKSGLLLAILESRADAVMETLDGALPGQADLASEIEQLLMDPVLKYWNERQFMRVCVARSVVDADIGRLVGERLNGAKVRFNAERLRHHQQAGRVRSDVDVDAVALALSGFSFSSGFFFQVVFEMNPPDIQDMVRHTAEIITRGIESESNRKGRETGAST